MNPETVILMVTDLNRPCDDTANSGFVHLVALESPDDDYFNEAPLCGISGGADWQRFEHTAVSLKHFCVECYEALADLAYDLDENGEE